MTDDIARLENDVHGNVTDRIVGLENDGRRNDEQLINTCNNNIFHKTVSSLS